MIYKSALELIGNTPLVEVPNLKSEFLLKANLLLKIEAYNLAGSAKDRIAKFMIEDAVNKGVLKKGDTIIEPTSGNTGIGLAALGSIMGYKVIIVMPDNMSKERANILKAYGAEVVFTDAKEGMKGAIEKSKELQLSIKNSIILDQFSNFSNPKAHMESTAKEIYKDTKGNVDILVAGVGTGGTITGIAKYLKSVKENIKIFAVEPEKCPMLSKGVGGCHQIQGLGMSAGFIPPILDLNLIDDVITVKDEEAFEYSKLLMKREGLMTGISSGAVLKAGIELALKNENKDKNIVAVLPDSANRYFSSKLFI